MTTTTAPSPDVFAIDPGQMTAYLARCHASAEGLPLPTPAPEGESQEIPHDWDHEHLYRVEWLLQEAFACQAITSRVPGLTINFETSDDDMGDPWYKWQVTSASLSWCAAQATWTEAVDLGSSTGRGPARVQAVFEEAVKICNDLAAQSRIAHAGPVLVLPCPAGTEPGELLQDLIDGMSNAVEYRAPDIADFCGDCKKTEKPGGVTEVEFCDDHGIDDENARIYAKVQKHLEQVQVQRDTYGLQAG